MSSKLIDPAYAQMLAEAELRRPKPFNYYHPAVLGWCFKLHQGPKLATRWGKFLKKVLFLKSDTDKEIDRLISYRRALLAKQDCSK